MSIKEALRSSLNLFALGEQCGEGNANGQSNKKKLERVKVIEDGILAAIEAQSQAEEAIRAALESLDPEDNLQAVVELKSALSRLGEQP